MSFEEEDEVTILTKFKIANNMMSFVIFHNGTMDVIFEFISPIMKPDEEAKEKAYRIAAESDLIYTESQFIDLSDELTMFLYEGNRIRVLLIMRKAAVDDVVRTHLPKLVEDFSEEFEDKYSKELKNYSGNGEVFSEAADMFTKQISLDLALPHYAKYVGFEPDSKLEQYLFGAADELTRKIGYFYLPNLLYATKEYVREKARELVMSNPKKAKKMGIDPDNIDFPPNEQFFIGMYNLRKLGMLIPIKIEELHSYSKIKYPKPGSAG